MKTSKVINSLGALYLGILLTLFTTFLTGCAVPLLLGVKEVRTAGGTEVKFITGGDFRIGANGIDTVEDNRGIKPGGGARAQSAVNKGGY
jgi:hypothetical protein